MTKPADEDLDFERICRLCLAEKRSMSSIFTSKESCDYRVPLHQRIMSCASVVLYEGDGLPGQICSKCLIAVNQSFALREQVEAADSQLREMLQRLSQPTEETTATPCVEETKDENGQAYSSECEVIILDDDDVKPSPSSLTTRDILAVLSKHPGLTITRKSSVADSCDLPEEKENDEEEEEDFSEDRGDYVYFNDLVSQGDDEPPAEKPADKSNENLIGTPGTFDILKWKPPPRDLVRRQEINRKMKECAEETEGGRIFCKECKIFIRRAYFYNHIKFAKRHANLRDFLCQECGYRAPTGHILRAHIDAVHSGNRYSCEQCDKSFSSVKRLNHHVKKFHAPTGPVERPYICQFCGKQWTSQHCLRNHIRTHTKEMPYKCQYCDRRFSFRWPCKTHERLHTGDKPYRCSFCPEAFTQNCVRKNHEYRAHGNEEFNPKNRKPKEGNRREKRVKKKAGTDDGKVEETLSLEEKVKAAIGSE